MISSVGSEHYLDRVGVTGSNPVSPTMTKKIFLAPIVTLGIIFIVLGLRWMLVDEPWMLDKVANEERLEMSFDELLKINSKNLYITETIGHGTNLVTGDYSVGATGFLIENGEFKHPVNEITIAGNFNDMFKNITLANDLEFEYAINSPTMMIEGMVVAGK